MQRSPFGVAVSEPRLAEAASAALDRSGTAVDSCVAAFLMGAALWPSVALGAATVLTAGPGVGARCFEGPFLQPGKGAPRPRGFRDGDEIPSAATVGVSSAVVALYAAHAHDSTLPLRELASPAVKVASSQGFKGRASLLRAIGAGGPLALREAGFVRELLDVAGRAVGGCVTEDDLRDAAAVVTPPDSHPRVLRSPRVDRQEARAALESFVVCACDSRGAIAVLHVTHDPNGMDVPTHDVKAPRVAVPVRRGVPRVTPGVCLGGPAPVALVADDSGVVWCGAAFDSSTDVRLEGLGVDREAGITMEQVLRDLLAQGSYGRGACAVIRPSAAGGTVRTLRLQGTA